MALSIETCTRRQGVGEGGKAWESRRGAGFLVFLYLYVIAFMAAHSPLSVYLVDHVARSQAKFRSSSTLENLRDLAAIYWVDIQAQKSTLLQCDSLWHDLPE